MNFFTKNIPYINLTISLCGLAFQIGILNPLNNKINKKLDNIILKNTKNTKNIN
jgi:hypothetical protein